MKYKIIAREIVKQIENNNFSKGYQLPSIESLMEQFEVGKNTIIKALDLLNSAGIIYQVRGSGNFVRGHKRKGYINLLELEGFNSMLRDFELTSNVLEINVQFPNEEVRENLNIGPDEPVYYVKRQRYIQDQIFCIEESYYKKSIVPYLNEEIVSKSIFDYIRKDLNLQIGFADNFMKIIKLNEENADLLSLDQGDPGMAVETIYHLDNAQAFDYSKIIYHYEQTQFFVQGNSQFSLLN